jgi:hypothetical protein
VKVSRVRRSKRRSSYEQQDTVKKMHTPKNRRLKINRWGNYNDHNGYEQQQCDAVFRFEHFATSGRLTCPTHPDLQHV